MKYYIKTTHTERRRKWLFAGKHIIELISICIVDERGIAYHAVSSEFDTRFLDNNTRDKILVHVPGDYTERRKPLKEIAQDLADIFIEDQNAKLFGFECQYDFVLFCSLFKGIYRSDYPKFVPRSIVDLSQSIQEYVSDIDDSEFEKMLSLSLHFYRDKYTLDEKMSMFASHSMYPKSSYNPFYATEAAKWIMKLGKCFTAFKIQRKDLLQKEIKDTNDN